MRTSIYLVRSFILLALLNSFLFASIIGFWPFYGNISDLSGNGNDGLNFGASLSSDRFDNPDYAYSFNGTSDYIEYADTPSLDLTGAVSIEAWVYLDSTASNTNHTILLKAESNSNIVIPTTYSLGSSGTSSYRFCVGGQEILFGEIMFNEWTHIAVTFSHELQRARCFVNGEMIVDYPALLYDIQTSDYPLLVGADAEHDKNWHGVIDDIRLFDRMISESEVDSLYNLPFGPNLVTIPESVILLGEVYVGYPETTYVEISNYGLGFDPLDITNLEFSHGMFETDLTTISLASGESSTFSVVCNPYDQAWFTESLSITSNDTANGPHSITLSGVTLFPPNMVITPGIISDTLYTGGTISYDLTVDNSSGAGILGWTSRVVDETGSSTIYFERPDWVDWTQPEYQDQITPRAILARANTGNFFNAFMETEDSGWSSPRRIGFATGSLPQQDYFPWKLLCGDYPWNLLGSVVSVYCDYDDVQLELWLESWSSEGGGFSYTRTFLAPDWLEYDPIRTTQWTNNSYSDELRLDAFGLSGGDYSVIIRIDSNDPEANSVDIPITMTVIEAPDYETEYQNINFSEAFIGFPDTIDVEVLNQGFGDLIIFDIYLPGTDISVFPSSATINQDSSQLFTFVYNPEGMGDQSGDIVFTTNDPDELEVVIPVQAVGLHPPVIQTVTELITLDVEEDENLEYSFTIDNIGQSDLIFDLYIMNYIEESVANNHNSELFERGTYWGPTYLDSEDAEVAQDLKSLSIGLREEEVLLHLEGHDPLYLREVLFFLDTDMNSETGAIMPWGIGAEYAISYYGSNDYSIVESDHWEDTNLDLSTVQYEPFSSELLLGLPASSFGNDLGWNMVISSAPSFGPITDLLPDSGLGYIHIPHRANWIHTTTNSDTIGQGESRTISLDINTASLPLGLNRALIHLINNDPAIRDLAIPIDVSVLVGTETNQLIPGKYALRQNYPNPFNPSTKIEYELPEIADVAITVYDIKGRNVWSYEESDKPAGYYSLQWNGLDQNGKQVASGVYLISFSTPEFRAVQKAVLIR